MWKGARFVWKGTNLSLQLRDRAIQLCARDGAGVHIVYVEVPEPVLLPPSRRRARPAPEPANQRLPSRWEVPDRSAAQRVGWKP